MWSFRVTYVSCGEDVIEIISGLFNGNRPQITDSDEMTENLHLVHDKGWLTVPGNNGAALFDTGGWNSRLMTKYLLYLIFLLY